MNLGDFASASDDATIGAAFILPAGKTSTIYSFESFITADSGTSLEIVRSDAPTTALATVGINDTGVNKDSSTSFPVTVRNTTASDIAVVFRAAGALTGGADGTAFVSYSDPGAA